jgi:hypothetical protein
MFLGLLLLVGGLIIFFAGEGGKGLLTSATAAPSTTTPAIMMMAAATIERWNVILKMILDMVGLTVLDSLPMNPYFSAIFQNAFFL